jgi:hypothetical protein
MRESTQASSTALTLPEEPLGAVVSHQTCLELVRIYQDSVGAIARCLSEIRAAGQALDAAFCAGGQRHSNFGIDPHFRGRTYHGRDGGDVSDWPDLFRKMKQTAWATLIDRLGVRKIMSVAKRAEFDHQLESGELPDITEESVLGIIGGLAGQAQDFAAEAAREVFGILRPNPGYGEGHKTNDAFRVGRRVILTWMVERRYDGKTFRVCYGRHEQELTAIDGVFHLLDGKGVLKGHKGPLQEAIEASPDGKGETGYFRFKCFKNRNLHIEFKRLDLVRQLNLLAAGEAVLGHDPD